MIFEAPWYKDKIETTAFTCHILSFEERADKIENLIGFRPRTEKELKYWEEKLKDGKIHQF